MSQGLKDEFKSFQKTKGSKWNSGRAPQLFKLIKAYKNACTKLEDPSALTADIQWLCLKIESAAKYFTTSEYSEVLECVVHFAEEKHIGSSKINKSIEPINKHHLTLDITRDFSAVMSALPNNYRQHI